MLGHREQVLAAERDRAELRENMQRLHEVLSQYAHGTRVHPPYDVSSNAAAEEVLYNITEVDLSSMT